MNEKKSLKLRLKAEKARDAGSLPRVLVVDNDPATLDVFSNFLGHQDFRIARATSAKQCLKAARGQKVDLVLLELLIPEMENGLLALRRLKEDAKTAAIPVVIITAVGEPSVLAEAKRLGARECLVKPVFRRQLLRTVRSHLGATASVSEA